MVPSALVGMISLELITAIELEGNFSATLALFLMYSEALAGSYLIKFFGLNKGKKYTLITNS
jgi:hypothetical protein